MMTSTYASATEVDDATRISATVSPPPRNHQLTAAAVGDSGESNTTTESGSAHLVTLQNQVQHRRQDVADNGGEGERANDAVFEPAAPHNDIMNQQNASPEQPASEVANTDLLSVAYFNPGQSQMLHGNGLEVHQAEAQDMALEGQSGLPPVRADGAGHHPDVPQFMMPEGEVTGTPGQIATSLDHEGLADAHALLNMLNQYGPQPGSEAPDVQATRIQAYAKLEFGDGEFYMNTYSVYLGRDIQVARAAVRRDREEERSKRDLGDLGGSDGEPHTPVQIKREESKYSISVLSETGGILRECAGSDGDRRARKKKSRKASKGSKSTGSSSRHASRRNSMAKMNGFTTYQPQAPSRHAVPETVGAASFDLAALRPSPFECPLIGIHPPASVPASAYKSISRRHVKIEYSLSKRLFEAKILGRNGAFVDDEFYHYKDVKELKSGSVLQIGCVTVRFVLPDVVPGQTGAEQGYEYEDNLIADRYSEGGKEMSFDFEGGTRTGVNLDETSEGSEDEGGYQIPHQEEDNDEEEREENENEEMEGLDDQEDEQEDEDTLENGDQSNLVGNGDAEELAEDREELQSPELMHDKKRGPGRPPKDGVMSKREKQLAKKEALAQQRQKQKPKKPSQAVQEPSASSPTTGKNKVGRPRKHPRPDTPPVQKEKRKYTKRKPKEPKDPNGGQDGSVDDQPAKDKKEKKPAKPPRSPSPVVNESHFSAEELAKPAANYVSLIYEALTQSKTGPLSLPDIYRAIQRRYPYFRFRCATNGWQSSVRHNLSQHNAFAKVDKEGKGFSWTVVEGASIEKEKKKRTTPPPQGYPSMHRQPIYQPGYHPHMMHQYPPGMMGPPGPPPPGYQISYSMPPNGQHLQHPQFVPQNGHPPHQTNAHPPMNGHYPPFPISIPPQLAAPNNGTYSSPYAPKPPVTTTPQRNEQRANEVSNPVPQPALKATSSQPLTPARPEVPTTAPETAQTVTNHRDGDVQQYIGIVRKSLLKMFRGLQYEDSYTDAILSTAARHFQGISTEGPLNRNEEMALSVMNKGWASFVNKGWISFQDDLGEPDQMSSSELNSSLHQQQEEEQEQGQGQPQAQPTPDEAGTQGSTVQQPNLSIGSERSASSLVRPSFSGRPNGASLSRPPLKTPGIQRMNSGSPASAPPRQSMSPFSASPAAHPKQSKPPFSTSPKASSPAIDSLTVVSPNTPLTNGASAPKLATNGNGPAAEQPETSSEDSLFMQETKRLNEDGQIAGPKRTLENADESQDRKRRATSGMPHLRT